MYSMPFPTIDGYHIHSKIGEGVLTQVYLAQQENTALKVALKVLPPHLVKDETLEKLALREAHDAAKLSHQSIASIYAYGVNNGFLYVAMEYLPGGNLKQRMLKGISIEEAIRIIKLLARGLYHAAQKNLVHRDIKPENIFFRDDGTPVISDFGMTRSLEALSDAHALGSLLGTPRYMSPEQVQEYAIDHRSDLYSLSVILYELLCGQAPFISDSAISVSIKHITELPPPLPPQLSAFQGIIDKALEKSPEQRFQTGDELANALEQAEQQISKEHAQTLIKNTSDLLTETAATHRRPGLRNGTNGNNPFITPPTSYPTEAVANTSQVSPVYKKPAFIALTFLVTLILALSTWYWTSMRTAEALNPSQYNPANIIPGMAEKAEELLHKARAAMQADHLFEPAQDNAQYYLTTLLALVPHHATARSEISQLFEHYLNRAEALVNASDIDLAEPFLDQASQISYYIENQAIKQRFTLLYQSFQQTRQRLIAESERSKKIEELLQKAENALLAQQLTSPPGDNAFDYFQQILLEAPQHGKAHEGIERTALALLQNARLKAQENMFPLAHAFIAAAAQIAPGLSQISATQNEILQRQQVEQSTKANAQALGRSETGLADIPDNRQDDLNAQQKQIEDWLMHAQHHFLAGRLTEPDEDNALALYNRVLAIDFLNIAAIQGREQIGAALVENANAKARAGKFAEARTLLETASTVLTIKSSLVSARQLIGQLEQRRNIDQLLEKAEAALQMDRLELPEQDNAVSYYKQVLALDPSNIRARQGVEAVGLKYIELSREALSRENYSLARRKIEKAKHYTTSEIEISMAERFLSEAASTQKVTQLLTAAKSALARNQWTKPANDNAHYYYQQVLALAPSNPEALEGIARLRARYRPLFDQALKASDFAKAREWLVILKDMQDKDQHNLLKEQLNLAEATHAQKLVEEKADAEQKRQAQLLLNQQLIDRYLAEIDTLKQSQSHAEQNLALIDRYLAILDIVPGHASAEAGLNTSIQHEEALALEALKDLRMADAETHIKNIHAAVPRHDVSKLHQIKIESEHKLKEISDITVEIEALLARPYTKPGWLDSHREERDKLMSTYAQIDYLRQRNPGNDRIGDFLDRLDQKYAAITHRLIQEKSEGEAEKFITDTRHFDWRGINMALVTAGLTQVADKTDLARIEKDRAVNWLLSESRSLLDQPYVKPGFLGSHQATRARLIKIYDYLHAARRLSPDNDQIENMLSELDQNYAEIVTRLSKNNNAAEANAFIQDTRMLQWQGPRLTSALNNN